MARLIPCLKATEPGVDSTGVPIMDGVGAIGAGGDLIEPGLMVGATISGGLAIGDGIVIGGGVIIGGGVGIIGRGDIAIGGMVEGDMAGAWPEDKATNVSEKVSMSMECEKPMTLSYYQRV